MTTAAATMIDSTKIHDAIASATAKINAADRSRAWILAELINDLRDLVNEPTATRAAAKINSSPKITTATRNADLADASARCLAAANRRLSVLRG